MIIWLITLFLIGTDGLPDGAPKSACSSLMPDHAGHTAQTSKAPYEIHAELSGKKVNVRVSSPDGEKFDGFILQARSNKDPSKFIDGEFTVGQTFKAIDCFEGKKNTLTHVNTNSKDEIMTEWVPKENIEDAVIFRGTIAKKFDTFWDKVDSNPVIPMTAEVSDFFHKDHETCFKLEGCLFFPHHCGDSQNCEVLLKYSRSSDGIQFTLQGILESSQYMAMGLSEDAIMGKDSVTECIRDGTNVIARESWNEGKSNTRTKQLPKERYSGSFDNGVTTCSWKLPLTTVLNGETYDFVNKTYYLLIAKGPVSEGESKYHFDKMASEGALNLTEYPKPDIDSPNTEPQDPQTTTPHLMDSTRKDESSTGKDGNSGSSGLESTFMILLLSGLFFAAKESLNDYILKCLF